MLHVVLWLWRHGDIFFYTLFFSFSLFCPHSWHMTKWVNVLILLNSRENEGPALCDKMCLDSLNFFLFSPLCGEIWSSHWKHGISLPVSGTKSWRMTKDQTHAQWGRTVRACTTLPVNTLHTAQNDSSVLKKKKAHNSRKSKCILRLAVVKDIYPYCTYAHLCIWD